MRGEMISKTNATPVTQMERISGRPEKHSVTLRGHRTSVSLEQVFWEALRDIAEERGQPINALVAEVDENRGPGVGLGSALRVFILHRYRQAA